MKRHLAAILILMSLGTLPTFAAQLSATDAGIAVDAGSMGKFQLSYPELIDKQDKASKPIEARGNGKVATIKYAGGTEITATVEDAKTVAVTFKNPPDDFVKFKMGMLIDFSYGDGGKWRIGDGDTKPFPARKPEKPHLYQGTQSTFVLTNFEGKQLAFAIPEYSFQQLQDNREWNWKIFAWTFWTPTRPGVARYTIGISEKAPESGAQPAAVVDRFGQDAALDFPGKVTSEDDLKGDIERDRAYYESLQPPALDAFGGLPGSGEKLGLKKTGFFHVEKAAGRWVMVDPKGNAVFHLGVCSFTPGESYTYIKGREQIYAWLPPYDGEYHTAYHPEKYWARDTFSFYLANVIRKYGKPWDVEEWTARMIPRVRRFGFNATGAFSGSTQAHRNAGFPYVSSLPLNTWQIGRHIKGLRGLFDPFDAETLRKMDALFEKTVAPHANDPLLIGYFLANEQAFEDVPRVIPSLTAAQPAKKRLVAMLREKYGAIDKLNAAWGMSAASFDALEDAGLLVTTKAASEDMQAFTELFIDEYFLRIAEAFHKHDANHMLLGNRWQPGTANNRTLCRITGEYVDLISLNYYTYGVDRAFLDRIHEWTGDKPMMLSEFYWASPSDTGLPGGKEVANQRERGLAYRNYVEQTAAMPYIVGIEWFTLVDQARTGRWFEKYGGENANTGLFNVADRPYRDCLDEMMKTNYDIYSVMFGDRAPFAWDDPRFSTKGRGTKTVKAPRAVGPMTLDGNRDDWPGDPPQRIGASQLVEGASAGGVEAVFRLCWDDKNLYLLVEATDPTPMKNEKRGSDIWSGDGVELFIGHEKLDQPGTLLFTDRQVLLSAGLPGGKPQWHIANAPKQVPCELAVAPKVDDTGYTMEAAIPFEALGFAPKAGQRMLFDIAIDDSTDGTSRRCQLMWNGIARNSGDRTHWGRAALLK